MYQFFIGMSIPEAELSGLWASSKDLETPDCKWQRENAHRPSPVVITRENSEVLHLAFVLVVFVFSH